ncbi:hypothetical protein LCGC14_0812940 [marine sediment metagenome]|uniref:Uncharacterized protein n=1 Tax=marine sediment metagenome TaxID=412755 RepID=A0A0F9PQP0_9ZZZZ
MKAQSYSIQWKNSRGETQTGPELWTHGDFVLDMVSESLTQIEAPRLKTYQEALELATNMNTSPEFNNTTHKVIIYKGKNRADKPAPTGAIEGFTPVFLLPSAKIGRPRNSYGDVKFQIDIAPYREPTIFRCTALVA